MLMSRGIIKLGVSRNNRTEIDLIITINDF